jgi:xylose dehydrogenase (NAD/NADP)
VSGIPQAVSIDKSIEGFTDRDWESNTDGTLRFALVGLGWWVREEVLPKLEDSDLCEPTVLVSGSEEKATAVASRTGTRGISYDAFHNGTASEMYDAVYVCTPNAFHLPYVRTAGELGKAVLCEKPMEASVDRAVEMNETCDEYDIPLMIAYRMQTAPEVRRARTLIKEGFIGEPVHVLSDNTQRLLSLIPSPDQWRLDPNVAGYGTSVMDIGLYSINTARYLLDSDPEAVQSMMASHDEAFADVPDERAVFSVSFEDGTLATCTTSQNAQESTCLRITGKAGQIQLDPAFQMETGVRLVRGETNVDIETPQTNQMVEVFDFFADRVLTGTDDYPNGDHGLVDMRTMEAIYDAASSGKRTLVTHE